MYKFAIDRPITVLMGVLAFIIFGLMSYKTMPVNLFPNVDFPIITVQTVYHGADPETVESKVTDKIEEAVSGVDGIDKLTSTSSEGISVVVIQFELTKDIDEAANDVRDKVNGIIFPNDVNKPLVKKVAAAGGSVINLYVASKTGDDISLMRLADEKLKPRLQRVEGVGEISIVGFRDREIRVFPDPFLLNKYGITLTELQGLLARDNVRAGGGKLIGSSSELVLKARGDAKTLEEIQNLKILPGVRLKDIAEVKDSLSDAKSFSSLNGNPGIMLEIKKISGKNTLDIINGVKAAMPDIEKMAGKDYELQLLRDQSGKILANMDNVTFDLIFGSILAIIIVFVFLRNGTATMVSALAIPTSVIGTFAVIDLLGYDLNRLTMIGLTLAIGIFIDDAIVVIENIAKKMEHGMKPFEASVEGVKEIVFSVLAIASMLLAVFIPVAFMDGIVGMFFNSFAMTVASGIVLSFFIATMLIPTVGARVLKGGESKFFHMTEPYLAMMDKMYVKLLKPLIRFKYFTIVGIFAMIFVVGGLLKHVGGDFVPMEDNSEFQVFIKAPVGISLDEMKRKTEPLAAKMKEDERVKYTIFSVGYNTAKDAHKARIYTKLVPVTEREEGQLEIIQEYREMFGKIQGMKVSVEKVSDFDTGGTQAPVQVVLKGPELGELDKISQKVQGLLREVDGVVDIDTDYETGKPEVKISILRENAKRLGISANDIALALGSSFSSDSAISTYEDEGRQFDITVRFSDENRMVLEDLKRIQIKTSSGELVSLEGVVKFEESLGTASINRFDRERKILITANLNGIPVGDVVAAVGDKLDALLPVGYTYRFTGDIENMADTNKAFGAAVGLAVILIFLILASLYESVIQPLIIMVAMPLSFIGVVLALFLTGKPFSLFVMIGIILLLGMVGKNSILIVDFANRAIKDGKSVDEALLEAGERRLRPIVMTTLAIIFAMIPLAFGSGAGHESNSPMAVAIIGGLLSSTILALFIVPAIYKILYPIDAFFRKFYDKDQIIAREAKQN